MIADVETMVRDSVGEVFTTMLKIEATFEPLGTVVDGSEAQVAGAVGFIGTAMGVVYIYLGSHLARVATANLLGMEESEIEGEAMVNDAVGELTNMIVGQMKSRMSDNGIRCALTIPSIVRGSHFSIESISSSERKVVSFKTPMGRFIVEALMKPAEEAA